MDFAAVAGRLVSGRPNAGLWFSITFRANVGMIVVPPVGLEPTTYGLQNPVGRVAPVNRGSPTVNTGGWRPHRQGQTANHVNLNHYVPILL
jgi:hypothetical protein